MKTRSQTRYECNIIKIDIDFDEASELWKSNKKYVGNGCYKYICACLTKTGNQCKREPMQGLDFCKLHNKLQKLP